MKYKLIVDKQSKTNPSVDKREYEIDVEELRFKDDVADSLVITVEETYIMRRLSLSEYHVLSVLETPIKEPLGDLNVQLFEGENYIYLMDMTGNKFYAEYIVKNEFNNLYVTNVQMNSAINQSAQEVEIKVNQKLTGYSTTQETEAMIDAKADEVTLGVKEKISPLTGENSLSNSSFEDGLNNWNTETAGSTTGSVSVQENNNTKYAQIVSKSGWTKLLQVIKGILKNIEYTLTFDAYDNGDLEIDTEEGIFQVNVIQAQENSEENIEVTTERIYVTKENQTYTVKFTPTNSTDIQLIFGLKNPFSSENTMSVMISNITLSGGGVNEKIAKLDIKSDEIKAKVEKKVDEETVTGAYLILKINEDTSEAKLSADKIELSANDILNLLAGNTINLSSQNIVIASANFNVDKNGNATMNNVTINGGNIIIDNDSNSYASAAMKFKSSSTKSYMSSQALELYKNDLSRGIGIAIDGIQGAYQILAYSENGSAGIGFGEIWADGNVYAANISSDKRLKDNIQKSIANALEKIKSIELKSFDWKKSKKHIDIGFIAQELEKIDENFVLKKPIKDEEGNIVDYLYYVNELPIIATATKAIQEQQEEIEELQEKDKQKDILIQSLLERTERLEAQND